MLLVIKILLVTALLAYVITWVGERLTGNSDKK